LFGVALCNADTRIRWRPEGLFEGKTVPAGTGGSVAVALLSSGLAAAETHRFWHAARILPQDGRWFRITCRFDGRGVDGRANVQTCMTSVCNGMPVTP
jgi:hypothetical protein